MFPVLFSVPVRFTTPPARENASPAVVKAPPRFRVLAALASSRSVPLVDQVLPTVNIPPLMASTVPALVKLPLG